MAAGIVKSMQTRCSECEAIMKIPVGESGEILKGDYFVNFSNNGKNIEYAQCKDCYPAKLAIANF